MRTILLRTVVFLILFAGIYIGVVGFSANYARPNSNLENFFSRYTNIKIAMLRPDFYNSGTLRRFRELEKFGNLDILFIGSSHAFSSFNPLIFDSLGIRSFNAGSVGQSPINSYYLLERYYDKIHPKIVVMEVFYRMLSYRGDESFLDLYTNTKPSPVMRLMAWETHDIVVANAVLVNCLRRHKVNLDSMNIPYPTYRADGFATADINYDGKPDRFPPMRILPIQMNYIQKVQDFLRVRGTKLVLVVAPMPKPTMEAVPNLYELTGQIQILAKNNRIPFFDYNEMIELNTTEDFSDYSHLNLTGANKFTKIFIQDLIKNCLLVKTSNQMLELP